MTMVEWSSFICKIYMCVCVCVCMCVVYLLAPTQNNLVRVKERERGEREREREKERAVCVEHALAYHNAYLATCTTDPIPRYPGITV